MLRTRNNIEILTIRSYDVDSKCEAIADMINENWVYHNWQFKAHTEDCNLLIPTNVDLIINTSTEHFDSMDWFYRIPNGTVVAIQGNNMLHDDHVIHSSNLIEFKRLFPLKEFLFEGTKEFNYPSWSFTRFMIIGVK